ncbi:hypothetical protein BDC45DRAFT_608776 [Circinella umbellata]|nr:hypothetical protein BDC45DRAFT_608776 [Circinella umbellata]
MTKPTHIKTEKSSTTTAKSAKSTTRNNRRFDETIDQGVSVLQELQEKAVCVLALQAASWARKHKYQEELESAWTMINFAPKNPTGYLIVVGRRYIDQGLQERAIEVFNKDLNSASSSDPKYELLQDGTEIARIARRLGRTPGAASARFSMIYRSYQGYGGTRPPSRLPLQRQE